MPIFVAALVAARHNRHHNQRVVKHSEPLWLLLADEAAHALTQVVRRAAGLFAATRRDQGGDTS